MVSPICWATWETGDDTVATSIDSPLAEISWLNPSNGHSVPVPDLSHTSEKRRRLCAWQVGLRNQGVGPEVMGVRIYIRVRVEVTLDVLASFTWPGQCPSVSTVTQSKPSCYVKAWWGSCPKTTPQSSIHIYIHTYTSAQPKQYRLPYSGTLESLLFSLKQFLSYLLLLWLTSSLHLQSHKLPGFSTAVVCLLISSHHRPPSIPPWPALSFLG